MDLPVNRSLWICLTSTASVPLCNRLCPSTMSMTLQHISRDCDSTRSSHESLFIRFTECIELQTGVKPACPRTFSNKTTLAWLHTRGLWQPSSDWDYRLLLTVLRTGLDTTTIRRAGEFGQMIVVKEYGNEIVSTQNATVLAGTIH